MATKFMLRLWPVGWLVSWIAWGWDLTNEEALSLLVSHAKRFNLGFSAEGWPFNGWIVANSRTHIRELPAFAWDLGMRVEAPRWVRVRKRRPQGRK